MSHEPITLSLQPRLEAALEKLRTGSGQHCLSEHTFSNLYLFRDVHGYRFCDGDWPGITGTTYDGERHFMPLFDVATAPQTVLQTLIQTHGCLYPVASSSQHLLNPQTFKSWANEDDADYLYNAAHFRDYAGRALAKKRNLVRQFLTHHRSDAALLNEESTAAARHVLRGWMQQKGKDPGQADEAACLEALNHATRLGLEGFIHFVDGQPVAFVLVQALQPGVFAVRFAKGLDSHVGIYPFMFQHLCLHFPRSMHWLNFEQDMGIAGFRRSKRSYQPCDLLPKWRVTLQS